MGNLIFECEKDAAQIRVQHQVPFLNRIEVQRLFDGDPGVVEGHIEAAVGPHHLLDEVANAFFVEDIGRDVGGLAAGGADLLLHRASELLPTSAEAHLRALGGKSERGGAPDARGSAGDAHDLVVEPARPQPPRRRGRARSSQGDAGGEPGEPACDVHRGAEHLAPARVRFVFLLFGFHALEVRAGGAAIHGPEAMGVVRPKA